MGRIYVRVQLEYLGVPYSVEARFSELEQMNNVGEIIGVIERKIAEIRAKQEELTEERVFRKNQEGAGSEEE